MNIATIMKAEIERAAPNFCIVRTELPSAHAIDGLFKARATILNKRGESRDFGIEISQREAIIAGSADAIVSMVREKVVAEGIATFAALTPDDGA